VTRVRRSLTPVLLGLLLVGTIGCDRVTKRMAVQTLAGGPGRSFLGDTVRLGYAENPGGFLSLGTALPRAPRIAVFVVATGAILAAAALAMFRGALRGGALVGATLFLAGGASNWIDRVLHGSVVDFLNLGIGPLRTGIFNVADVAIMAGLLVLVFGARNRAPIGED
jgi:signal peptidase II